MDWKKISSGWTLRHFLIVLLCGIGLAAISWDWTVIKTMISSVAYFCLALALAGFGQYAYTSINFVQEKDSRILGYMFLGSCLIIFGTMLSYYYISNGALP